MTIGDIINEFIEEVGGDTTDTALQSRALIFCKNALRLIPLFIDHRQFKTLSAVTLLSGTYSATLPSGFVKESFVYYYNTPNASKQEIIGGDDFNFNFNIGSSGAPQYYRIFGSTIEFNQKADRDYTVYVECSINLDSVTTATTWVYPSDLLLCLKEGMKGFYWKDYTEEFDRGLKQLKLFSDMAGEIDAEESVAEQGTHIEEA